MFSFLNTKHKRKSAAITSVIMSLLLVLLFFVGMTYLDPPQEYGIAVNLVLPMLDKEMCSLKNH